MNDLSDMCSPYRVVLFDLDGTLSDPSEGILRCIRVALQQLAAPIPDTATLHTWIGPPLRDTLADHLGDRLAAERALALFRERFATVGLFENRLYPEVPALLAELHTRGCRLFLATGKPQPYARRILEHFGVLHLFRDVAGSSLDDSLNDKADIIATLLPHLAASERASCVMVGDRKHDVYGARAHQLPCIAVSYGYGTLAELTACAPARIVGSVAELHAVLTGTEHS